jgi:hypothetical protein
MCVKKILHAAMQITIDVVIEIVESIRPVRIAPIDEVHVEPGIEEATNQRPIDLQVHHARTVDEGVADQHWRDARRPRKRLIAIQGDLILTPHALLRGATRPRVRRAPNCRQRGA